MSSGIPLIGGGPQASAPLTKEEEAMVALVTKEQAAKSHQQWVMSHHMAVSGNILGLLVQSLAPTLLGDGNMFPGRMNKEQTLEEKLDDLSEIAMAAATVHLKRYGYNVAFKKAPPSPIQT